MGRNRACERFMADAKCLSGRCGSPRRQTVCCFPARHAESRRPAAVTPPQTGILGLSTGAGAPAGQPTPRDFRAGILRHSPVWIAPASCHRAERGRPTAAGKETDPHIGVSDSALFWTHSSDKGLREPVAGLAPARLAPPRLAAESYWA